MEHADVFDPLADSRLDLEANSTVLVHAKRETSEKVAVLSVKDPDGEEVRDLLPNRVYDNEGSLRADMEDHVVSWDQDTPVAILWEGREMLIASEDSAAFSVTVRPEVVEQISVLNLVDPNGQECSEVLPTRVYDSIQAFQSDLIEHSDWGTQDVRIHWEGQKPHPAAEANKPGELAGRPFQDKPALRLDERRQHTEGAAASVAGKDWPGRSDVVRNDAGLREPSPERAALTRALENLSERNKALRDRAALKAEHRRIRQSLDTLRFLEANAQQQGREIARRLPQVFRDPAKAYAAIRGAIDEQGADSAASTLRSKPQVFGQLMGDALLNRDARRRAEYKARQIADNLPAAEKAQQKALAEIPRHEQKKAAFAFVGAQLKILQVPEAPTSQNVRELLHAIPPEERRTIPAEERQVIAGELRQMRYVQYSRQHQQQQGGRGR